MIDSSEYISDSVQEVLPVLTIIIRYFSFNFSEEEKVTQGRVWPVSWMRQPFGS
jgi:hypothetical protein